MLFIMVVIRYFLMFFLLMMKTVITIIKRGETEAKEVWVVVESALDFQKIIIFRLQIPEWTHCI